MVRAVNEVGRGPMMSLPFAFAIQTGEPALQSGAGADRNVELLVAKPGDVA